MKEVSSQKKKDCFGTPKESSVNNTQKETASQKKRTNNESTDVDESRTSISMIYLEIDVATTTKMKSQMITYFLMNWTEKMHHLYHLKKGDQVEHRNQTKCFWLSTK
ncbi:hypothetical protein GHT06_017106 [Daphnia sinensis]|uniref:Uncharacterized protein n=1 Tax=Daphnia sinensis TaxID=1820382 RepID=A0AAD5PRM6_9CRUS|nr:hypothetical protein GHT06_017106 [Daphnia sinensis]